MQPTWVRSIKKQCTRDGVPFFFKQWGGTRKKSSGRILDGRTYSNFPKYNPAISRNPTGTAIPPVPWTAFVPVEALASA
jgi:hypothetical protein